MLVGGRYYPSLEHAYQAMKATNKEDMAWVRCAINPREAKKRGNEIVCREDWEDVKLRFMEKLVYLKFTSNPYLCEKLLETKGEELVEGNWWKDTFWGVCNGVGENNLGKILMKVRDQIIESRELHDGGN